MNLMSRKKPMRLVIKISHGMKLLRIKISHISDLIKYFNQTKCLSIGGPTLGAGGAIETPKLWIFHYNYIKYEDHGREKKNHTHVLSTPQKASAPLVFYKSVNKYKQVL